MEKNNKVGYGVVRDKNGVPRIDGDPKDLHPAIQVQLTVEERENLGLWTGAFIRDAQGIKRLEKDGDNYIAIDALVAASDIYDGADQYRLSQRIDLPVGGRIIKGN